MSDFGAFGGSDEEYATVRKHDAEIVRDGSFIITHRILTDPGRVDIGS